MFHKEYAELLNIEESEYVKFFPSTLCVLTGIQTKSSRDITPKLLKPAIDFMSSIGIINAIKNALAQSGVNMDLLNVKKENPDLIKGEC